MNPTWMIALDLGGTDLKAGLVDRAGTLDHFTRLPSRTEESAEAPLEVIAEAVEELRARSDSRIGGAGLGSPGVIHPVNGAMVGRTAHLPHWDSIALRERLSEWLGSAKFAVWLAQSLGRADLPQPPQRAVAHPIPEWR